MAKLNYGKRFSQHGAGGYKFNEGLDRDMREITAHIAAIWKNQPQYKKDIVYHEKKMRYLKKKAALGNGRQDAEERMVEAVYKCVAMLEWHMNDMMEHRPVPGIKRLCNQIGIQNAIVQLRTKCGVAFKPNAEYDHREHFKTDKPRGATSEQVTAGMKAQKEARDRRYREIADRLIARGKNV